MIEQLKPVDFGVLIAAAVMALGAFCPIVSFPIVGSLNYVMGGRGDGIIILGCSAAIIALTIFGHRITSAIVAAGALLMMMVTITRFAAVLSKAQADAALSAKSKALGGLISIMANSVGLEWGWVLLFGGAIGVLALALLAPRQGVSSTEIQSKTEEKEYRSFSSADEVIAEYLKNRPTSSGASNTTQNPSFGRKGPQ